MITQTESGLTAGQYSELQTLSTGATYAMTLELMSFTWSNLTGSDVEPEFDSDVTTERLIRAVAGSSIIVSGCWSTGSSWSTLETITGADGDVYPSVYAGGTDTIRVFYYTGTDIKYVESTDQGDTWGSAVTVGTLANVAWLAATSTTKLHVATYDDYNTRLHFYEYSGSWSKTDSNFYYPDTFDGFDAETLNGEDVILFGAFGQERYTTSRQGIWAVCQRGSTWGGVQEVDVVDEYVHGSVARLLPTLSTIDDKLFALFQVKNGNFSAVSYSRSGSGRFWQHRQPLGAYNFRAKMHALGDYTFLLDGDYLYRSLSTPITGQAMTTHDLTGRVTQYGFSQEKMHQVQIVVDNDDGSLVDLTGFERWRLREEVGYWDAGGTALLVQQALCETDVISTSSTLPVSEVEISARDDLAWMTDRTEADHYNEFDSQLRHWDGFENVEDSATQKEILHSGMGHTATMTGYWSTEEGAVDDEYELWLRSNNKEGLALCTVSKFIGHTIVQEAFQVPTANNNEWAGVVFRALDEDNYWCAYYDQASDKIKLRQKQSGTYQASVAETGTLSWSVATWYYIRVEAFLSRFVVYYSTDGATFTQAFAYVDTNITDEVIDAYKEGYVGHTGFGYSDEDTDPYEPPSYDPPDPWVAPILSYTLYDQFIVGTDNGIAYAETEDVITGGTPTWTACSGGLSNANVKQIMLRQENDQAWCITDDGLYSTSLPVSGSTTWSKIVSYASIYSALGWGSDCQMRGLQASWLDTDKMWMMVHAYNSSTSRWIPYCAITGNSWSTYTLYRIGTGQSQFMYGYDLKVVNDGTENTLYCSACNYQFGGALFKSTNGGTSWSIAQNLGSYGQFRHIAVHPGDANILIVGGGNGHEYLSENGASSWTTDVNLAENSTQGHCRRDGVGVAMPYFLTQKRARQYRVGSNDTQDGDTYSSPWVDWHGAAQPVGDDMLAFDGYCCGWGTTNKFGYFVSTGRREVTPTGPEVMQTEDTGTYTYVTQNLQSVLSSATVGQCIGWEGGEWDE
jgi:hypothetical protein